MGRESSGRAASSGRASECDLEEHDHADHTFQRSSAQQIPPARGGTRPERERGRRRDVPCGAMDDAELVASALDESPHAFAAIYDRYVDRIYDYARSVLRSDADAADVTQETFLAASQRLDQLRDPSKLRPWLYAIARSHSFRIVRERERTQVSDDIDGVAEMTAPEGEIDARELVWSAAAGLAASDRDILDLHLRQGLDGQELADVLGVTANVANVALHRVRTRLEESIGAVLLAKTSKKECPELDVLMVDGLNPLARKRIARHINKCVICEDRRRAMVSPSVLFASTPLAVAPLLMRDRFLESIGTASAIEASDSLGWRADGFPIAEPIARVAGVGGATTRAKRRARLVAIASSAAVVLLGVAGLFLLLQSDTAGSDEIAVEPAVTSAAGAAQSTTEPAAPSTTTRPEGTTTSPATILATPPPSTLATLSNAPASPTTAVPPSLAAAPRLPPAAAPPVAAPPPAPDPTLPDPVVASTVADVPVPTDPAATDPVVTDPEVTTTVAETVPAVPVISLVNFECATTMQVTVDVDPSASVSGRFETLAGQSTPLVAHSTTQGRFSAELAIGEGRVTPRVVATGPGGTSTLTLADCIIIG